MDPQQNNMPIGASYFCIDRFEGAYAVLMAEDESTMDVLRNTLPKGAKQSDWLIQFADGSYQIDAVKTQQRKTELRGRLDALLKRNKVK